MGEDLSEPTFLVSPPHYLLLTPTALVLSCASSLKPRGQARSLMCMCVCVHMCACV